MFYSERFHVLAVVVLSETSAGRNIRLLYDDASCRIGVWRLHTLFRVTRPSSRISIATEDGLSSAAQSKEGPYDGAGAAGRLLAKFEAMQKAIVCYQR